MSESMREWESEPDRKHWVDAASGLDCLIVRNPVLLTLCGYVGVPAGHPWYGKDYDQIRAKVRGGLTFAGICDGHICHDPAREVVAHAEVWWVGFDTAHSFDSIPRLDQLFLFDRLLGSEWSAHRDRLNAFRTYKNLAYVEGECRVLAAQARAAAGGDD